MNEMAKKYSKLLLDEMHRSLKMEHCYKILNMVAVQDKKKDIVLKIFAELQAEEDERRKHGKPICS